MYVYVTVKIMLNKIFESEFEFESNSFLNSTMLESMVHYSEHGLDSNVICLITYLYSEK